MNNKIILPAEVKVCATCSYWDGERQVDDEMQVVVVDENCHGECLAQEVDKPGLHDIRGEHQCIWEDVDADENAAGAGNTPPAATGT
jgi:hypothetical protein